MKRLTGIVLALLLVGIAYPQVATDSLLQIGRMAYQSGDYSKAIAYYRQYLAIAEGRNDDVSAANALRLIGDAFRASGELKTALTQLQDGLQRAQHAGDSMIIGKMHDRLAAVYFELGDHKATEAEATTALGIAKAVDDLTTVSSALNILGATYRNLGATERALNALSESVIIQRKIGDTTDVPNALNNMANTLYGDHRYAAAIDTAKHSYAMALSLKIPVYQQYAAMVLYNSYYALQDYRQAFEWLDVYSGLSNFMMDQAKTKEVSKLKAEMETAQQEQENQRLTTENALQLQTIAGQKTLAVAVGIGGLLILVIAVGLAFMARRQKKVNVALREKNLRIEQQTQQISSINVELERVATERERQKARLEEINQVKDKLFSIISHDLRSPLTSIQGMLQLMEQGILDEEESAKMANTLKTRVDHTTILLDNLLNWSHAQMEGFAVQPESIDMHELVFHESKLLEAAATSKGLEVKNHVPAAHAALGDREMVGLVLRNLISNAMKFTESGGSVHIHSVMVGEELQVAVRDTGVGIPDQYLDKVLGNEYFSTAGTEKEKGSGIGLRLCREFLNKNNGRIWVEKNPDKGSTFWFSLPTIVAS